MHEQSDATLIAWDLGRQWFANVWAEFTPPGIAIAEAGAYGCEPDHVNDDWLFAAMILDVQRFVFGDVGDESVGAFMSPATPEELSGIVDDSTIGRMLAVIDDDLDVEPERRLHELDGLTVRDAVIWNGARIQVEGVHVMSLDEAGGTDFRRDAKRRDNGGPKGVYAWPASVRARLISGTATTHSSRERYATSAGTKHWTAGHTGPGGLRALRAQGYATTYTIDIPSKLDGRVVVYQTLDPARDRGIHAGNPANRRAFTSCDYANPAVTKHAERQLKRTGIPRPLIRASYHHRRNRPILGAYKGQILADLRVSRAFCKLGGFPLCFQVDDEGRPLTGVIKDLWRHPSRRGFHLHLHLTTNKYDVAGLLEQIAVMLLTDRSFMAEFPELASQLRIHDAHWMPWLDEVEQSWTWGEVWPAHAL